MSTIKDVARISGFSVSTVSRCLNNSGYVSEEARVEIEKVAKELNYRPTYSAQMLRTNRSNIIALILVTLRNSYFVELAEHIDRICLEKGYHLILCNIDSDDNKEKAYLDLIDKINPEGVILAGVETVYDALKEYPSVIIDRLDKNHRSISSVTTNNTQGARLLTEHLIEVGCKNILFLGPEIGNFASLERKESYIKIVEENGMNPNYIFTDIIEDLDINEIMKYDGIFAWNDEVAVDVLFYLQRHGYKVPEDMKLVGYDNNYMSQRVSPTITTIDQSYELIAETSVDLLINRINNEVDDNEQIQLETGILIRESTTVK